MYPAAGFAVTLIFHFAGLRWGMSAFAAFVGWPLVGMIATADDDLPGGWSNPDGTVPPPWRTSLYRGQMCEGLAIASLISALDLGIRTNSGLIFVALSVATGAIALRLLSPHWQTDRKE